MGSFVISDDDQSTDNTKRPRGRFVLSDDSQKEPTIMDRIRAGAAGINKGFYSDLLGIPVDTAANIIDLPKALIGWGASKMTDSPPPTWKEPYNREKTPGTADWIAKNINLGSSALGIGSPIDNPRPDDALSRAIYSGGRVGGASILPIPSSAISGSQTAINVGKGALGGLAAGVAGE